ncbi:hypothetical protein ACFE04_001819 [Oxalis oulophora]
MKASLKFRDDQKPLLRAKVPLSILSLPFQSGVIAGDSKELTLNLSTFFESGPSIKLAYRPNDTWNPFSLIVKTGTGPFGSPISSSMLMSAEFNLLGNGNPNFMLHFKPQFGDFSIKKKSSQAPPACFLDKLGTLKKSNFSDDDDVSSIEIVNPSPPPKEGKFTVLPSVVAADMAGLFSGVEVAARTALPVRGRAVVNVRWGVRVPAETYESITPSMKKIPFLVMSKIGIEHVESRCDDSKTEAVALSVRGNADAGENAFSVKRQLEMLQSDNGSLKKAIEELKHEICSWKSISYSTERNNGASKFRNDKRSSESDPSEELKKTMKGV